MTDCDRTVQPGSRVRIRDASGHVQSVQIRAPGAWSFDAIQPNTPLGRAVIGNHVGDEVEVVMVEGILTRRVTIEAIE
jgi:transcription elongation GreA/GreB family factor